MENLAGFGARFLRNISSRFSRASTVPTSAGTFQPDARGMASVLLPNLPKETEAKPST